MEILAWSKSGKFLRINFIPDFWTSRNSFWLKNQIDI